MRGGTSDGAKKAAATRRKKYGESFFKDMGRKGGLARNESPKANMPFNDKEVASKAAKKGLAIRWAKPRNKDEGPVT